MKATLEYDMSDEFERNAHHQAVNAGKAYRALWEIRELIGKRARLMERFEEVEREVLQALENNGIDLDEDVI